MQRTVWSDEVAWPSLSDAATMLRLHKATISRHVRRGHVKARLMGLGQARRVIPPLEVLRLGQLYRRVPLEELEQHLASFLAERAHADAEAIRQDLAAACTAVDADEPIDEPMSQEAIPAWMKEFDRLLALPDPHFDSEPFTASGEDAAAVYTGTYREADDVTLTELTGLDPAVFGS